MKAPRLRAKEAYQDNEGRIDACRDQIRRLNDELTRRQIARAKLRQEWIG